MPRSMHLQTSYILKLYVINKGILKGSVYTTTFWTQQNKIDTTVVNIRFYLRLVATQIKNKYLHSVSILFYCVQNVVV
jgi:hypothetical protein